MKNYLILSYLILLGLIYPSIVMISDDYSHPIEELSSHFEFFNSPITQIYANECNILDSLENLSNQDIIIWNKNIPFDENEKIFLENFKLNEGVFILFGKEIFDEPYFFINQFGGSYLRNISANYVIINNDTLNFNFSIDAIEIQLIGEFGNGLTFYEENSLAAIYNKSFFLNGFWLEEIPFNNRQIYVESLFEEINKDEVLLKIENVTIENNSEIEIPILLENDIEISNFEIIINMEHEYLYQYEILPTDRAIGLEWDIIDLPFGNLNIKGNYNNQNIMDGDGSIAIINANSQSNAVGKIALQIIDTSILDSLNEEVLVNTINGEIEFSQSQPTIYFSENNSIQLGEAEKVEMFLQNEMEISGFQICLEFDSSELLFVQAIPTERIPEDWWVGQFGQGSNDEIQIASLGFSNLLPGTGPILEIELLSVGENSIQSTIQFCDLYLLNEDSQSLENQVISTEIQIFSPQIYVTPQLINSSNYSDLIFSYNSNQIFNGFQIDIEAQNENFLQLIGYFGGYITGNYIDGTTNKILGFSQNSENFFPENGRIFMISFNYLNSLENYVEYDNLMFSDNQGEIVYNKINPLVFNDFLFGDIDANGVIDIKDILVINNYIISDLELGLAQLENSDIDFNGNLDIFDVLQLLQIIIM